MGKNYRPTAEEEAEMPEQFQTEAVPTPPVVNPEIKQSAPPKKATMPDWESLVKGLPHR